MYIRCQSLNYSVLVRHIRAPVNDPPQIFSLWYILNSANRSSFVGVAPCFMGSNLTLPPLPRFARFTRFARHLRRASGCCESARLQGSMAVSSWSGFRSVAISILYIYCRILQYLCRYSDGMAVFGLGAVALSLPLSPGAPLFGSATTWHLNIYNIRIIRRNAAYLICKCCRAVVVHVKCISGNKNIKAR